MYEKTFYKSLKRYARRMGMPFEISQEDLIIPDTCPVTNRPINIYGPSCSPSKPTVSCLDWKKGYVPGNIEIISKKGRDIREHRRKKLRDYGSKTNITLPTLTFMGDEVLAHINSIHPSKNNFKKTV